MEETYTLRTLDKDCVAFEENGVRSFLVTGTKRALLVDTGFGGGDLLAAVQAQTSLPLTVVVTHADRDHIGCNRQFAEIFMHPAEYDRYKSAHGDVNRLRPLWEGDVLDLGGRAFRVLLIPGHTPGSIALLDEANKLLIGGDTVQNGGIFLFGPGRNLHAFLQSLQKLEVLDIETVYPSHGEIPLSAEILPKLSGDIREILAGRREGVPGEMYGNKITKYTGAATYLCDPKPEYT